MEVAVLLLMLLVCLVSGVVLVYWGYPDYRVEVYFKKTEGTPEADP